MVFTPRTAEEERRIQKEVERELASIPVLQEEATRCEEQLTKLHPASRAYGVMLRNVIALRRELEHRTGKVEWDREQVAIFNAILSLKKSDIAREMDGPCSVRDEVHSFEETFDFDSFLNIETAPRNC